MMDFRRTCLVTKSNQGPFTTYQTDHVAPVSRAPDMEKRRFHVARTASADRSFAQCCPSALSVAVLGPSVSVHKDKRRLLNLPCPTSPPHQAPLDG
jgi:hypothetical protein